MLTEEELLYLINAYKRYFESPSSDPSLSRVLKGCSYQLRSLINLSDPRGYYHRTCQLELFIYITDPMMITDSSHKLSE